MARGLMGLGVSPLLKIRQHGFQMRFFPTALSAELWIDPDCRGVDQAFFQKYLRAGDVVVDVGANVGNLALLAASLVGPMGKVYAVEPHPRTFHFLQQNIAINKFANVQAVNLALGNRQAKVLLTDNKWDDLNRVCEGEPGIEVGMRPLDDLTIAEPEIHLLKIDVEGFEKFVLEGAATTLQKTQCVYFEASEEHSRIYSYAARDLLTILKRAEFDVYRLSESSHIVPVTEQNLACETENLLAAKKLDEIVARTHFSRSQDD